MAKVSVALKIDVSKIDKERLYKGQKGTYLDAVIFLDLGEADQYGNHGMITQSVSKAEKESGVRGAILGNGKIIWRDGGDQVTPSKPAQQAQQSADALDADIPFDNPYRGFRSLIL